MPEILVPDLELYRLAEHFHVSPVEIDRAWSIADVERALLALDVIQDAQILQMPKPPKPRPRR